MSASESDRPAGRLAERMLDLGRAIQWLKRAPRTGWLLRGVPPGEAESVAAHTCGVALVALALAELVDQPVDVERLLSICLVHDLAEAVLSDLPRTASRYLPEGAKQEAERRVLADLLAGLPFAERWLALWQEYDADATVEARLAHDADRLDMALQAAAYEEAGRSGLDEFWQSSGRDWRFAESAALFGRLVERRSSPSDEAKAEEMSAPATPAPDCN